MYKIYNQTCKYFLKMDFDDVETCKKVIEDLQDLTICYSDGKHPDKYIIYKKIFPKEVEK